MKTKGFLSFILILFLLSTSATSWAQNIDPTSSQILLAAAPALVGAQYVLEGDETVTVGWDPVSGAGAYEIRLLLLHLTPATYFALARIPATETSVTIAQPRAGMFQVEARTCRYADCNCGIDADGDGQLDDCSIWVFSTDPTVGMVNGVNMGWWIYWKLLGVGGPIIE